MKIAVFTSITASYLPNAAILADSLTKHQPDWDFYLLFNDRTPPHLKWEEQPFQNVMFAEWLPIPRPWLRFAYGYSVIEFCTATKGVMAQHLLRTLGYDAVVYFDPDTCVFSPLSEILEILEQGEAEVILTPHLTDAERDDDREGIWSHEISALKHGTFNLGFFVFKNGPRGLQVLNWWEQRLLDYSHIDFPYGTFTDQKWMNLAPLLFEGVHILVDRAYNVATWNTKGRTIDRTGNSTWTVNGRPLRFYHFSGFGNDFFWAKRELGLFGREGDRTGELWQCYEEWYKAEKAKNVSSLTPWRWSLDAFGRTIDKEMRQTLIRPDVVDPFHALS